MHLMPVMLWHCSDAQIRLSKTQAACKHLQAALSCCLNLNFGIQAVRGHGQRAHHGFVIKEGQFVAYLLQTHAVHHRVIMVGRGDGQPEGFALVLPVHQALVVLAQ